MRRIFQGLPTWKPIEPHWGNRRRNTSHRSGQLGRMVSISLLIYSIAPLHKHGDCIKRCGLETRGTWTQSENCCRHSTGVSCLTPRVVFFEATEICFYPLNDANVASLTIFAMLVSKTARQWDFIHVCVGVACCPAHASFLAWTGGGEP